MIDWSYVVANCLWIAGLGILLSAASYHRYVAQVSDCTFTEVVRSPRQRVAYDTGTIMFCVGWALGQVQSRWVSALWLVLAVGKAATAYLRERRASRSARPERPDGPAGAIRRSE